MTTDRRHDHPIAPNRPAWNFEAVRPNQGWLADLACILTGKSRPYLAAILDMDTRNIAWVRRDLIHDIEGFYHPAACNEPWATSAPKRWNAERLNPVHFFGGRSDLVTLVLLALRWRLKRAIFGE